MWNLKYATNELIYKTEADSQTQKTNLWLPKEKDGRGISQELVISGYKVLYIRQINNKVLLYSTGKYIQYLIINHSGKEHEKEYIYIYIKNNHFAVQRKLIQHCKSTMLQFKKLKKNRSV